MKLSKRFIVVANLETKEIVETWETTYEDRLRVKERDRVNGLFVEKHKTLYQQYPFPKFEIWLYVVEDIEAIKRDNPHFNWEKAIFNKLVPVLD